MEKISVGGIEINADAIGRETYKLFDEHDQAVVAFGMMPAIKMEILEKNIRLKIGGIIAEKLCSPELVEDFAKCVKQSFVNEIIHGVIVGILGAASDAGKLVV